MLLLALAAAAMLLQAGAATSLAAKLRRVIVGTSGKDTLRGNAADNKIYGGRSADRLFGGGGQRPDARPAPAATRSPAAPATTSSTATRPPT